MRDRRGVIHAKTGVLPLMMETTVHSRGRTWGSSALVLAAVLLCACTVPSVESPAPATEADSLPGDTHVHHEIDYIEISVTDMEDAKHFYEAAFGWEFNDYGPDYAGIRKEVGEAGGLRLQPQVSRGGPLVILYSDDLDGTLAGVREAGARILQEPFEFPRRPPVPLRGPERKRARCLVQEVSATPWCSKIRLTESCSLPIVESQQTTEAFTALNGSRSAFDPGKLDQLPAEALMIALPMIVLDVFLEDVPEMTLTQDHQPIEALGSDREHKALRVGIQVGAPIWKPHRPHACSLEQFTELLP